MNTPETNPWSSVFQKLPAVLIIIGTLYFFSVSEDLSAVQLFSLGGLLICAIGLLFSLRIAYLGCMVFLYYFSTLLFLGFVHYWIAGHGEETPVFVVVLFQLFITAIMAMLIGLLTTNPTAGKYKGPSRKWLIIGSGIGLGIAVHFLC